MKGVACRCLFFRVGKKALGPCLFIVTRTCERGAGFWHAACFGEAVVPGSASRIVRGDLDISGC